MKTKLTIALLSIVLLTWVGCRTPQEEKAPKKYTITQFMDIVPIAGGAFSPDESKLLINTRETGIFNAYEIDLKSGEKKQLTNSTDNAIFGQSYFPADDRIFFTSDKGGNEITHIYVRNTNGSTQSECALGQRISYRGYSKCNTIFCCRSSFPKNWL